MINLFGGGVLINEEGEYKREVSDWQSLCPSCHKKDGILMKYF